MESNQINLKYTYKNRYNLNPGLCRWYSTSVKSSLALPVPVLTITNLQEKSHISSKRTLLSNKAGIYSFINKVNRKQYIGSAKDLYLRLNEHLSNKKSNRALQSAIVKYGLANFEFGVYEYFSYVNKLTSNKLLTDLETNYIKKFNFNTLYNFMQTATSLAGYKHTEEARLKMVARYADKTNHPFWNKHHDDETKLLISKPGALNPMYGKTHTEETKNLMRLKRKIYTNGVGIYDLNNNLLKSFDYATDLATNLGISKVTVGKYLNKGLVYKEKYYFKVIK